MKNTFNRVAVFVRGSTRELHRELHKKTPSVERVRELAENAHVNVFLSPTRFSYARIAPLGICAKKYRECILAAEASAYDAPEMRKRAADYLEMAKIIRQKGAQPEYGPNNIQADGDAGVPAKYHKNALDWLYEGLDDRKQKLMADFFQEIFAKPSPLKFSFAVKMGKIFPNR